MPGDLCCAEGRNLDCCRLLVLEQAVFIFGGFVGELVNGIHPSSRPRIQFDRRYCTEMG